MVRENAASYVRGTAAIKYPVSRSSRSCAKQPRLHGSGDIRVVSYPVRKTAHQTAALGDRFWKIVASSEMACSLLTEDVRGCAYNKFSHMDVAVCASVVSLISLISIFVGA